MPEGPEIETTELQEKIHEAHREGGHDSWTRSIALTTAILAVFAAVGALQAGSLVNESMIAQLHASDTWSEYQASRQKSHMYTIAMNALADAGASPKRATEYKKQVDKEDAKAAALSEKAKKFEEESRKQMEKHHRFAYEVAMLQVAIALGAVSALTRVRWVWGVSMLLGAVGLVMFAIGFAK